MTTVKADFSEVWLAGMTLYRNKLTFRFYLPLGNSLNDLHKQPAFWITSCLQVALTRDGTGLRSVFVIKLDKAEGALSSSSVWEGCWYMEGEQSCCLEGHKHSGIPDQQQHHEIDKWGAWPLAKSNPMHCKVKARHRLIWYSKRTQESWQKASWTRISSEVLLQRWLCAYWAAKSEHCNGPREWVIPLLMALVRLHLKCTLMVFRLPIGEIVSQ